MLDKFKEFINRISPSDRVAVIFHNDCDGICSGFIASESLTKLGHAPKLVLATSAASALSMRLVKKLQRERITKTISLDLALDQVSEVVAEIASFSDLLIIDHHPLYKDIQTEKVTTIKSNPHLKIKRYFPASIMAFNLFSELVNIKNLDWVAACGIIGDSGYLQSKQFVNRVMRKYNIHPAQDLFSTDLGRSAAYIGAAADITPDKISSALKTLKKVKSPKELVKSSLEKTFKKVEREIQHQMDLFEKNSETKDDTILGEINSRFKVKSVIVTRLSMSKYPNKTVIILQKSGKFYLISARRQDKKVAVNDLLERAVKGLKDAGAGGHKPAAGGFIRLEDLDAFKERVLCK